MLQILSEMVKVGRHCLIHYCLNDMLKSDLGLSVQDLVFFADKPPLHVDIADGNGNQTADPAVMEFRL
jgi:hypothetical protein